MNQQPHPPNDPNRPADDNPPEPREPARRRRRRRWPIALILGLLVAIVALLALAPALISAGFGDSLVMGAVDRSIRGSVSADGLTLRWFGGQRIDGLTLNDPQGRRVLAVDQFETDLTLWNALRGRYDLGRTTAQGVVGHVIVEADGSDNLREAVESPEPEPEAEPDEPTRLPESLAADAELIDAELTVEAPDIQPVVFEGLHAEAEFTSPAEPIALRLAGRSRQGEIAGSFEADARIRNLTDASGRLTPDPIRAEATARTTDLPVEGVDRLLGLNGRLAAALGPRLDLQLNSTATTQRQNFSLNAESEHANVLLVGHVVGNRLQLDEPGTLDWTVTPAFVHRLQAAAEAETADGSQPAAGGDEATLRLRESVPVHLQLQRAVLPLGGFQPDQTSVEAELTAEAPVHLADNGRLGELTIHGLAARLTGEPLTEAIRFNLDADLQTETEPGTLTASGTATNLFNAHGQFQPDAFGADATIEARNLPTALPDRIAGRDNLLAEALGPRLNLTANAATTDEQRVELDLTLGSERLETAEPLALTVSDRVSLRQPGTLRYTLTPAFAGRFLGNGDEALALREPLPLALTVNRLSAPLPLQENRPAFRPEETLVHATVEADQAELANVPRLGDLTAQQTRIELRGDSLAAFTASLATALSEPQPGLLTEAVGSEPLRVNAETSGVLRRDDFDLRNVLADLQSERLRAHLPLTLNEGGVLTPAEDPGDQPAGATVTVTPELLRLLGIKGGADQPTLAEPATAELAFTRLRAPSRPPFSLARIEAAAEADVPQIRLTGGDQLDGAALRNVHTALSFSGTDRTAGVELRGETLLPDQPEPAPIQLAAEMSEILDDNGQLRLAEAPVEATANLEGVPTAVLAGLTGQPEAKLRPLIGPALRVEAAANLTGGTALADRTGRINFQAGAEHLDATAAFRLENRRLHLAEADEPATARLELTPAAYAAWTTAPTGGSEQRTQQGRATEQRSQNGGVTGGERISRPRGSAPAEGGDENERRSPTPPSYELAGPVTVEAVLDRLAWPLLGAGPGAQAAAGEQPSADPGETALNARITASPLTLRQPATEGQVTLRDFEATAAAENLAEALDLEITGRIDHEPGEPIAAAPQRAAAQQTGGSSGEGSDQQTQQENPSGDTGPGRIDVRATLHEPMTAAAGGGLDLDRLGLDLSATLENAPVGPVDRWFGQDGLWVASLGRSLNAEASAELRNGAGPVVARLRSSAAQADVEAEYREGSLHLTAPLLAELRMNEALGRRLFASINPLFESVRSGGDPIRLRIEPENAVVPVRGFALGRIRAPQTRVELGTLKMTNGGLLGAAITIAQQAGELEGHAQGGVVNARFTPMVLSIADGRVEYDRRLDLLIDRSLHLATWGTVDLPQPTAEGPAAPARFNLVLGFPAETLDRVFDLENLPPGTMFRIPLIGAAGQLDPQQILSSALSDMARLQAQARLSGEDKLLGQVLGGVVGRILRGDRAEGPEAPPPSVQPLPWRQPGDTQQREEQPQQEPQREQERSREKSDEDRVRDLLNDLLQ